MKLYELDPAGTMAALVDGKLQELTHDFTPGSKIQWLSPIKNETASKIYSRGLRFLLAKAAHEVYGKKLLVKYFLHSGMYCEIAGLKIDESIVAKIDAKVKQYILEDTPFEKIGMSTQEAQKFFYERGHMDTYNMLQYKNKPTSTVYKNGNYYDYFFGFMPYSTGSLGDYTVLLHGDGFIIKYLNPYETGKLQIEAQPKVSKCIKEAKDWSEFIGVASVFELNNSVKENRLPEIIRLCETLHDNRLASIAKSIIDRKNVRLIKVAGPSSSGKTTFTKRLSEHLKVNGIDTFTISIDDYYISRSEVVPDVNGKIDLERIDIINIEKLNGDLAKLIDGQEVYLSKYDFKTSKSLIEHTPTRLRDNQMILLEGIHGLNQVMGKSIPESEIYKIFIEPFSTLNLDYDNCIEPQDIRLLRRLVRDSQCRASNFETTLSLWSSIREGEYKYILPYQEQADSLFNSSLCYEPLFLKKYALDSLKKIPTNSPFFYEVNHMISFLEYFLDPEGENGIKPDSILREFIGGSCFS